MPTTTKTQLAAVLFDLDGTLIDTAPDFAVVVNQLCQQHQRPPLEYKAIRATVSHGARALITRAFGLQEGEGEFESLKAQLLQLYSQHLAVKSQLFPGIDKLLQQLEQQAIPWGIVTNKPRLYAQPLLEGLQLSKRCAVLVCPDDVSRTKPDPEPMYLACRQLGCKPSSVIYLGDHRRDIEAGNNAGMATLAVNYGYIEDSDPTLLWQADYIVDHASEIAALLSQHFNFLATAG